MFVHATLVCGCYRSCLSGIRFSCSNFSSRLLLIFTNTMPNQANITSRAWPRAQRNTRRSERAGVRRGLIVHEFVAAGFPAQSFDVVCSFDVIEHLPSPMPIFQEARRVLRPGGWLLLGTGDSRAFTARLAGSRWTYLCFPEHLSFFNSYCLRKGLANAGFSSFRF